jgi:hypothetical protein
MNIINNVNELATAIGVDIGGIAKAVYKGTNCGAWINLKANKVEMGSIIEGSDAETNTFILEYPFDIKTFWDKLQLIDDEAEILWNEANGGE